MTFPPATISGLENLSIAPPSPTFDQEGGFPSSVSRKSRLAIV